MHQLLLKYDGWMQAVSESMCTSQLPATSEQNAYVYLTHESIWLQRRIDSMFRCTGTEMEAADVGRHS